MGDLISRKALIDFLDENVLDDEMLVNQYNADWIYSFIESAPAVDAVEVVRCRDCKHMYLRNGLRWCDAWGEINGMGDDGFCNYGERKEQGDGRD